jgi:hypothetical protein
MNCWQINLMHVFNWKVGFFPLKSIKQSVCVREREVGIMESCKQYDKLKHHNLDWKMMTTNIILYDLATFDSINVPIASLFSCRESGHHFHPLKNTNRLIFYWVGWSILVVLLDVLVIRTWQRSLGRFQLLHYFIPRLHNPSEV